MKRAYVDSSVWINRVEGCDDYQQIVRSHLQKLEEDQWRMCVSDLVFLEVLCKPYWLDQAKRVRVYHSLFEPVPLLKPSPDLFQAAFHISCREKLKALDALHIALAVQNQCELFVTADSHFKNLSSLPVHLIDLVPSE